MISSPPNGETQAMSNAEEYEDRAARIASELGELCETHQIVVGVAESLTGGKIASQLAAVPGSGNWFAGAVVAYFSDVKHQLLRVPRGPVISQTAAESMASSASTLLGSDAAVAASGAGGPSGQEGQEPGTTWLAVAVGSEVYSERQIFSGEPIEILAQTQERALALLRDVLREAI